jgi:hypothetical protein
MSAYGESAASKLTGMLGLPSPEELEGGDALGLVQEYAPVVSQLIKGLSAKEQQAVLQVKVQNLQKYANVPFIGELARNRIREYEAQLAILPEMIAAEEKRQKTVQLMYTMGVIAVGAVAIAALASAIKKLRS